MKKTLGFVMAALLLIAAYMILPVHGERGLYDNVVRLHVLAESDSQRDQSLKLTVRDAVLEKTQPLLEIRSFLISTYPKPRRDKGSGFQNQMYL